MAIKAFVIHLERAKSRRPQVDLLAQMLPIAVDVLPAVDGQNVSSAELASVFRKVKHRPSYPFRLSRNEIACFLSHRVAWRRILDEGLDAALIVEDDAAIASEDFAEVLATATGDLLPNEVVRFPHRDRNESGPVVRSRGQVKLIEPRLPGLGTVMQLVGREAARRLLAASPDFDRPVDSFVQMQWVHGARILSARPIVVREVCAELGGSVIHARKTGLVRRVIREVRRPLSRLAVHRANERWRRRAA